MKPPKKAFTVELDGIILRQLDARAKVMGRSRSAEVNYLLEKAIVEQVDDQVTVVYPVEEPKRTSVNLNETTRQMLEANAKENHRSPGRQLNILLKAIIQKMTDDQRRIEDAFMTSRQFRDQQQPGQ